MVQKLEMGYCPLSMRLGAGRRRARLGVLGAGAAGAGALGRQALGRAGRAGAGRAGGCGAQAGRRQLARQAQAWARGALGVSVWSARRGRACARRLGVLAGQLG